jgi:spoIIIJ-associated protein
MEEQIFDPEQQETLRKTTEALLKLMGFRGVGVMIKQNMPDEPFTVAISLDDAGMLIGEHGANLRAFEYVLKLVARKMMPDAPRFIVDINAYREERISELKEYVKTVASRVVRENKDIELEPMSSYERRIVHTELASRPDITTESTGEGIDRRVVVKPLK